MPKTIEQKEKILARLAKNLEEKKEKCNFSRIHGQQRKTIETELKTKQKEFFAKQSASEKRNARKLKKGTSSVLIDDIAEKDAKPEIYLVQGFPCILGHLKRDGRCLLSPALHVVSVENYCSDEEIDDNIECVEFVPEIFCNTVENGCNIITINIVSAFKQDKQLFVISFPRFYYPEISMLLYI